MTCHHPLDDPVGLIRCIQALWAGADDGIRVVRDQTVARIHCRMPEPRGAACGMRELDPLLLHPYVVQAAWGRRGAGIRIRHDSQEGIHRRAMDLRRSGTP